MEFYKKWWFWIILIILVILIFPKSCGTKFPSKAVDYKCIGFKADLLEKIQSNQTYNMCYGICYEKLILQPKQNQTNQSTSNISNPVKQMISQFEKIITPLIGILIAIAVIYMIQSIQRRSK